MTLPTDEEIKWLRGREEEIGSAGSTARWKAIKLGGGHHECEKCGATVFGSVECSCWYLIENKKTMRDIVSPDLIKSAQQFAERIKDGTTKNRHTTLYDEDEIEWDKLSKEIEDVGSDFPGFGKVFAEVNKVWDKDNKSVNQQCYLTYIYLKGWYDKVIDKEIKPTIPDALKFEDYEVDIDKVDFQPMPCFTRLPKDEQEAFNDFLKANSTIVKKDVMNKEDKPQFTEEQARELLEHVVIEGNYTKFKGLLPSQFNQTIQVFKEVGYIIPVKSEEPPLHVGDIVVIKATGKEAKVEMDINEDGKYNVGFDDTWVGWYTREELELKDVKKEEEPLIVHNEAIDHDSKIATEYSENWLKKQSILIEQINNDMLASQQMINSNLRANVLAQKLIENSLETKAMVIRQMIQAISTYKYNKIEISQEVLSIVNEALEEKE